MCVQYERASQLNILCLNSTNLTIGVLVKGGLDDGRGKARVNLFRHKHEIETGRTSSVGMEIMGFDSKGGIVVSSVPGRKLSWEEIGQRAAKVITFTDLAGHER
jgi:GTPase